MTLQFGAQPHRAPSDTTHHGVKLYCVVVGIAADASLGATPVLCLLRLARARRILSGEVVTRHRTSRFAASTSIRRTVTMNRIATLILLMTIGSAMPTLVLAQPNDIKKSGSAVTPMQGMEMKGMGIDGKTATESHKGIGVVKTINKADGVVTLSHEPIKSLGWPAMTMGFKVKDKVLMDKIKSGDKVEFTLVQAGKDYVITSIK